MLKQLTNTVLGALVNFRQRLYDALVYRADALFNLLDSLSGNTMAQSVVELNLNAPSPDSIAVCTMGWITCS